MASTLTERAYQYINRRIIAGTLEPGNRLSDVELAREIGVSRTPAREAIAQLVALGVVEHMPGLGPCVKRLNRRELEEVFDLREMLESGIAARAAERITAAELAELEKSCEQYRVMAHTARDVAQSTGAHHEQVVLLDIAFHLKILRAARNRTVARIVADAHLLTRILRRRAELPSVSYRHRIAQSCLAHARIVRALKRRDSQAAQRWMSAHVKDAKAYHLAAFDWEQSVQKTQDTYVPEYLSQAMADMESAVAQNGGKTFGRGANPQCHRGRGMK